MNITWKKLNQETAKRNKELFRLFKNGEMSMNELANKYKISRQRVGKIIKGIKEKRNTIDK